MTTTNQKPLPAKYVPADHEPEVSRRWDEARAFHANPQRVLSGEARPYCILIPPPNVTAALHLGHALNNTLQDILIRHHRMRGFETLWMPGTDHAGIATQTVVEKRVLAEEGKKRTDFGRAEFVAKIQAFKDEYEQRITEQLKAMGCSCDWDRQRFTMDDICARAVREAFFRLFKEGLIYRGKRLVNWDPVTQTALADDEVENEEIEGIFAYLRYPLVHQTEPGNHSPVTWSELAARGYPGADQFPEDDQAYVTVATTRPETYLGDTAVAMNRRDPRHTSLVGLFVELPLVGRVIPIIEDDYVVLPVSLGGDESDPKAKMATGFLKVTPAHDPNDWEIGQRHNLPIINVMAPDASISADHGWDDYDPHHGAHVYIGLSREEARKKVLDEFKARNLLEAVKPHVHSVGHSYRSHAAIEPYLSDQWYVKVTDDRLRGAALRAMNPEQRSSGLPNLGGTGVPPVSTPSHPPSQEGIPDHLTIYTRHLPHWQLGGSTYFLTFRTQQGELSNAERQLVLDACFHWHGKRVTTHLAVVMPDHVHLLLTPLKRASGDWWPLQDILHSIKSFTAHEISTSRDNPGPIWQDETFDRIVRDEDEFREKWNYMLMNPVKAGLVRALGDYAFVKCGEEGEDGRDTRPTEARKAAGDNHLTFHPARYAKTYETWHENLRDWCISRQLWWGHQIPVWTISRQDFEAKDILNTLEQKFQDEFAIQHTGDDPDAEIVAICAAPDPGLERFLNSIGAVRDQDVLDTWFSSALWPMSTMGWPDPQAAGPEFLGMLDAFNPSSVLCTAREIITLWVSRMVMFNRYLLTNDESEGPIPFHDVFIHAMIQDGQGRKMSKSLGNGVDPLDIIHSHGTDAMRYTLCEMTTQTQDVRLPVEYDESTGRNTSTKFDKGRNFCTKLFNATKFTIMMLDEKAGSEPETVDPASLDPIDRWMLSRLSRATHDINAAIESYHFSSYAQTLFELLRNDFCDWYLEAIKPSLADNPAQRVVLQQSLETILRLLHPVTPFITELLNEYITHRRTGRILGLDLPFGTNPDLLCTSGWPNADQTLIDETIETQFAHMQSLVEEIRRVRAKHQVHPRRRITLHADAALINQLAGLAPVAQTLAGLAAITTDPPAGESVAMTFNSTEYALSDLADAVDADTERQRLEEKVADLDKSIMALEKRLANPGYTEKAPKHLVDETRATLEQQCADRQAALARLAELA